MQILTASMRHIRLFMSNFRRTDGFLAELLICLIQAGSDMMAHDLWDNNMRPSNTWKVGLRPTVLVVQDRKATLFVS